MLRESANNASSRSYWRSASREAIRDWQLQRVNDLLRAILPENRFYRERLGESFCVDDWNAWRRLPWLFKADLVSADVDVAAHHTWSIERYQRFHRTSGTRGRPLTILDTQGDWQWWIDTWQYVLDAADVDSHDRALMAFSFGPFIGFWSGFDALQARGSLLVPAGGMNSLARLQLAADTQATILCCTPTYALHLAAVAKQEAFDLHRLKMHKIIVAGEPGGSMVTVRTRISQAWNAEVCDHAGATEIGPWGFGSSDGRGLHVIESEFIAEIIDPVTGAPTAEGEVGELVLTNLGRIGAPVIRYRTGDLVRGWWNHAQPCRFLWLEGGILGRADDMVVVRGVNIFPSSIEAVIREFSELDEFRLTIRRAAEMDEIHVDVESASEDVVKRLAVALQQRLGLRVPVSRVAPGSLPRHEGKARRVVDTRVLPSLG